MLMLVCVWSIDSVSEPPHSASCAAAVPGRTAESPGRERALCGRPLPNASLPLHHCPMCTASMCRHLQMR
eukprot:2761971-Alexandrium_andersonii.AAC.1